MVNAVVSFLVIISLSISACNKAQKNIHNRQFFAFGTLIEISYYGVDKADVDSATRAVEDLFLKQHYQWHAWEPGPLHQLNRAIAEGNKFAAPDSIIELIGLAQRFEAQSQGMFNPAIGRLLRLWGLQQDDPPGSQPDPAAIQATIDSAPSSLHLGIEDKTVRSSNRAVQLDFGAFAKGFAVGKAIDLLRSQGIDSAMVNAGGDLCASNQPGSRKWKIGIRNPRGPGILASIELDADTCIFTSGDYERYAEHEGKRLHHILDPRTGYPATGSRSVTVIADDPALADAAATAIFVAGSKDWHTIAGMMGIHYVLLVDAQGRLHMNPAMAGKLDIEPDPGHDIRMIEPLPI